MSRPYRGTEVEGRLLLDAGPSERGWHLLQTGLRCPQLRAYQEILEIRFKWSNPLVRGALLHMGAAHYYRRLQAFQDGEDPDQWHTPLDALRIFAARMDTDPDRNPRSPLFADHLEECISMVEHFMRRYKIERHGERILAVEQPFHTRVSTHDGKAEWYVGDKPPEHEGWLFSQRGDLVLYDTATGLCWLDDHKTTSRKSPQQIRGYFRSGQMQGYYNFGRRAFGDAFGGVRINLFIFRKKPRVERIVVPYYPHRAAAFPQTVRWGEREWQDAKRLATSPWDFPKVGIDNGSCEHRYGPCDGADLCDYGPTYRAVVEGEETPEDRGERGTFRIT